LLLEFYSGKKIVITAGPTYEKLDPVRFIGNYSTGKMGYAIAEELANIGAEVHLVSGPVHIKPINPNISLYKVESALEMLDVCTKLFPDCDIAIMAAAVADYRPESYEGFKIKKSADELVLRLVKNPDILATLGSRKKPGQLLIGFALETNNEIANAKEKLVRKNADAIVLNSLNDSGAGFSHQTNKITIILQKDIIFEYPLKDKQLVAKDIITCISENLKN
jgi:phosphopantothenoylcysteine decarboxylase/phosphopantothenate--cysteine ligase